MSFDNLKGKKNALQALQKQVQEKEKASGGTKDERIWKHTFDKTTKIGNSTIRFLPFGDNERLPWAEWYEYSFKTPAGRYWERSRATIGEKDPVAELNSFMWDRNQGDDQDQVKKRGRKHKFIANIVVVKDPANPANNGKNFLFVFGKAIHDKIMAAMVPKYDDQQPIPVFDFWKGANFNIRTKEKSTFVNYDDSSFSPAAQLHPDENLLRKWYDGMYDLAEFEAESNYKSYDELNKQMRKVLGERVVAGILGEQYDPSQTDNTGNAFSQQDNSQQSQTSDPFAGVGDSQSTEQTQESSDPFSQQASESSSDGGDPFANQNSSQDDSANGSSDPFAASSSGSDSGSSDNEDPFADIAF